MERPWRRPAALTTGTAQNKVPPASILRLCLLKPSPREKPNIAPGRIRKISASYKEFIRLSGRAFFHQEDFFAGLPRHGGLLNPLFYALIVATVGSMVGYLWSFAFGNSLMSTMSLSKGGAVALAFLIPILIFMGLVVAAVLLHVSLFLVGGANEDFEATFRVVCYSAAPDLFGVLPIIGGFIGLIWKIYITVVGVREVHGISTARSVLAFVLPTLVCCGLVVGGIALVFMVAGSSFTKT